MTAVEYSRTTLQKLVVRLTALFLLAAGFFIILFASVPRSISNTHSPVGPGTVHADAPPSGDSGDGGAADSADSGDSGCDGGDSCG